MPGLVLSCWVTDRYLNFTAQLTKPGSIALGPFLLLVENEDKDEIKVYFERRMSNVSGTDYILALIT